MSESVVADFIGRFHGPETAGREPVSGRVILSKKRLVLAGKSGKTTIPLSGVFDISVGEVPPDLREFFSDTVTVAYRHQGSRGVAVIEGDSDEMDRFVTVLFKALLHGTTAICRHPARLGGRVVDSEPAPAQVRLKSGSVEFTGATDFTVDLERVIDFEQSRGELAGKTRPVLRFVHMPDGQSMTSVVAVEDEREMNVLGRYIRMEYQDVMEEVREIDPNSDEIEALVSLYSAGENAHLKDIVNVEASQLTMILNSLADAGLIVDTGEATKLTPKGRVVVTQRLEQVNA